jgi:hypothetical protein
MAPHGQPQEPTELVFLARPSWLPMLVALGLSLLILGLFAWWPYSVAGALIFLPAVYAWIRAASGEVGRMPREQRPSAAVLPAVALRRPPTSDG